MVLCIFCLSKAMSVIPVSTTYATYGALTITAVTFLEFLNIIKLPIYMGQSGLTLIAVGVILLNVFGKVK